MTLQQVIDAITRHSGWSAPYTVSEVRFAVETEAAERRNDKRRRQIAADFKRKSREERCPCSGAMWQDCCTSIIDGALCACADQTRKHSDMDTIQCRMSYHRREP